MKFPKVTLSPVIKRNLPTILFVLIIPLGILVGYFFSNVKNLVTGGYKGALTPFNKLLYVAKVDGVGVPKAEWEKMLKSRYGQNAARDLIEVYTIKGELKKAGIKVSDEETNAEIATIETQLGGQSLDDVLKQQGMTLSDFRERIALQVGMKKLLSGRAVVTDEEVAEYIKAAGDNLEGSTDEEKAANAKKTLIDQKLGEEINTWFTELQGKVTVENYLEEK